MELVPLEDKEDLILDVVVIKAIEIQNAPSEEDVVCKEDNNSRGKKALKNYSRGTWTDR